MSTIEVLPLLSEKCKRWETMVEAACVSISNVSCRPSVAGRVRSTHADKKHRQCQTQLNMLSNQHLGFNEK